MVMAACPVRWGVTGSVGVTGNSLGCSEEAMVAAVMRKILFKADPDQNKNTKWVKSRYLEVPRSCFERVGDVEIYAVADLERGNEQRHVAVLHGYVESSPGGRHSDLRNGNREFEIIGMEEVIEDAICSFAWALDFSGSKGWSCAALTIPISQLRST